MRVDLALGRVFAKVDNHPSARRQNAVDLLQRTDRIRKILERSPAHDPIKRMIIKGHARHVAPPKIDVGALFPRMFAGQIDECLADVKARDLEFSELGKFDREVLRTRRRFQHPCSLGFCHLSLSLGTL